MPAAKKPTPKKASAKSAAKKPAVKKPAPKKATAKKSTTKSTGKSEKVEKKPTVKKTVKASEKKDSPKKESTKKAVTKKIEVKKANDVFRCPISGMPVKAEKPNISPKTLEKLKSLLLEERARHLSQADELALEADELIADREAGDTQFDEESGEGDSIAVERERTLFLSAEAMNTVEQIDRALERMKKGTYGVCVPSSRRINIARLEALPWTEVCVDCKARSERRR